MAKIGRVWVDEEYIEWVERFLQEELGRAPTIDDIANKIGDMLLSQREQIESNREEADDQEFATIQRDSEVEAIDGENGENVIDTADNTSNSTNESVPVENPT